MELHVCHDSYSFISVLDPRANNLGYSLVVSARWVANSEKDRLIIPSTDISYMDHWYDVR